MGAQPEGQIRQFLDKHLGPQVSEAEQIRLEAAEAPNAETAEALLREALSYEPDNAAVLLDLAERVLARRTHRRQRQGLRSPLRPGRHPRLRRRLQRRVRRIAGGGAARQGRVAREGPGATGGMVRRLPRPGHRQPRAAISGDVLELRPACSDARRLRGHSATVSGCPQHVAPAVPYARRGALTSQCRTSKRSRPAGRRP
jgi:hypothetical protein